MFQAQNLVNFKPEPDPKSLDQLTTLDGGLRKKKR